jgi:hypothetical protein
MSCRRCARIVRTVVLGLCIACSIAVAHGGDDDPARYYSVAQTSPPAVASGASGRDVTIQLSGVEARAIAGEVSATVT